MADTLDIALPKGRLGEKVVALLGESGMGCANLDEDSRKLVLENDDGSLRFFWVKPADVPIYVERGAPELAQTPLNIPGVTELPGAGLCITAEIAENVCEIHTSLNTFYFQYENICGTINCTPRRAGDRLRAVGRGCTKKLSDLFAEQGIPASERDLVPVLRDDKGVLAVVGFGQDERALPRGEGAGVVIRAKIEKDTIL